MLLPEIQGQLEELYDLETGHRVEDFLVTDRALIEALDRSSPGVSPPEKLLVSECGGELLLSLYLADELLAALEKNDPRRRLGGENLADFCTALEGVSHFVYLVHNANHDRPVSRLEMELQAEVDKFFLVLAVAARQGMRLEWGALSRRLFRGYRLVPGLDGREKRRYVTATRLARSFCAGVGLLGSSREVLRNELRRFYRKRHLDKFASALAPVPLRAP